MAQELLYTSAERGLGGLSQGYTTVARTRGMPPALAAALERCSSYPRRPTRAGRRPVKYLHVQVPAGGQTYQVLSRIAEVEAEVSGRDNFLAHHVALSAAELRRPGPVWLLRAPAFMRAAWDGQVKEYPQPRDVPQGRRTPAPCAAWERRTGDAGWAGVVAGAFRDDPQRPVYLLADDLDGDDWLALLDETIGLLPPEQRWGVTFSTLYDPTGPPYPCAWRCLPRQSDEGRKLARDPGRAIVLDLTDALGPAPDTPLVQQARTGDEPPPEAAPDWPAAAEVLAAPFVAVDPTDPAPRAPAPPTPPRRPGRANAEAPPPHAPADEADTDPAASPLFVWALRLAAGAIFLGVIGLLAALCYGLYQENSSLEQKLAEWKGEAEKASHRVVQVEKQSQKFKVEIDGLQKLRMRDEKAAADARSTLEQDRDKYKKQMESMQTGAKQQDEAWKRDMEKKVREANAEREKSNGEARRLEAQVKELHRPYKHTVVLTVSEDIKPAGRSAARTVGVRPLAEKASIAPTATVKKVHLPEEFLKDSMNEKWLRHDLLKEPGRGFTIRGKDTPTGQTEAEKEFFKCEITKDGSLEVTWAGELTKTLEHDKSRVQKTLEKHLPFMVIELAAKGSPEPIYLSLCPTVESVDEAKTILGADLPNAVIEISGHVKSLKVEPRSAEIKLADPPFQRFAVYRVVAGIRVDIVRPSPAADGKR